MHSTVRIIIVLVAVCFILPSLSAQKLPAPKKILKDMTLANRYFMEKWPDPGKRIVTNRDRASNIWTRGVYYEGLMALYDWNWIDAIQMAMPVFARLGVLYNDDRYFQRMHAMYMHTRNKEGENGLFNPEDNLWWRDKDFDPPYKEPNGEDCYWSRGNGWVIAALVRVLDIIPEDAENREQYINDFKAMAEALIKVQREDGFWNVSLHDPTHFGGKETTGTALFAYAMAWGVNNGLLDDNKYRPVITKAWNALSGETLQSNGFLGYVQGTGKEPADGQPVTVSSMPDFEDYGLGCFMLAGTEVYKMNR